MGLCSTAKRFLGSVEMDEIGHLGWNEGRWLRGASKQMLFKDCRGLGQTMRQGAGGLQLIEGKGPAMLPMQCQTSQNSNSSHDPEQGPIQQTMQSTQQG